MFCRNRKVFTSTLCIDKWRVGSYSFLVTTGNCNNNLCNHKLDIRINSEILNFEIIPMLCASSVSQDQKQWVTHTVCAVTLPHLTQSLLVITSQSKTICDIPHKSDSLVRGKSCYYRYNSVKQTSRKVHILYLYLHNPVLNSPLCYTHFAMKLKI